jgi:purine-cytosine permease-like protein
MALLLALLFLVGLPAVALAIIRFADTLLMKRIPQFDPANTKTRTDLYSMRAAYASFIVGLGVLAFWALAILILGFIATLKLLWP